MEDQLGDVLKRLFPRLVCPERVSWSGESVQLLLSMGVPASTFDGYRDEVDAMTATLLPLALATTLGVDVRPSCGTGVPDRSAVHGRAWQW